MPVTLADVAETLLAAESETEAPAIASPDKPPARPARRSATAAQVAANRRNAQHSTGPRTAEGKARSRANALKHGLAGAGICLPTEDAALVQERCLQLHEEVAPESIQEMMLIEALALAHVRMKRAARHEVALLTHRQRHAVAEFDEARLTEAESNLRNLGPHSATEYRRLVSTPEGVDLLIARLGDVRREVRRTDIRWTYIHGACLESFCGRNYHDRFTRSRGRSLSLALEFDPSELADDDRRAIDADYQGRIKDWAMPAMEALIDAEVAHLHDRRAALDHEAIARDRAEAAERALFDPSRDAALARRYEGAATRTFFRARQELADCARRRVADPAAPSALSEPSAATAEALDEGDRLTITDPADRAAPPTPPRRSWDRPGLASSGITTEQASAELSQPHYSQPPVPFDQAIPPLVTVLPPLARA